MNHTTYTQNCRLVSITETRLFFHTTIYQNTSDPTKDLPLFPSHGRKNPHSQKNKQKTHHQKWKKSALIIDALGEKKGLRALPPPERSSGVFEEVDLRVKRCLEPHAVGVAKPVGAVRTSAVHGSGGCHAHRP